MVMLEGNGRMTGHFFERLHSRALMCATSLHVQFHEKGVVSTVVDTQYRRIHLDATLLGVDRFRRER